MNLLVTGGCGFIGSNFVRQRLTGTTGGRLVNLDKLTYAGNPANLSDLAGDPRYTFVQGDIGDEALVGRLLAEHQVDAVVNFAAETHVDRSIDSPEPFIQANVVGTLRLLQRRPSPIGRPRQERNGRRSASCTSRRTRFTERSLPPTRPSRRRRLSRPIHPTRPRRRQATISSGRFTTPTGCPR